jgi:hypothetical protein
MLLVKYRKFFYYSLLNHKAVLFVDHFYSFDEFVGAADRFMAHENSELKRLTRHF